jgi:hypothetical protein
MSVTHEFEKYHKARDKGYQELKTNIKNLGESKLMYFASTHVE